MGLRLENFARGAWSGVLIEVGTGMGLVAVLVLLERHMVRDVEKRATTAAAEVVEQAAPDPTARCLELAEIGLPDAVAFGRRVVEHLAPKGSPGLAIGPEPARQQQPVSAQRPFDGRGGHVVAVGAHYRRDLSMPPRRPVGCVLRRQGLRSVDRRRRPRPLDRVVTGAELGESAAVCAFGDAGQEANLATGSCATAPRASRSAKGLGRRTPKPFCQIRSCTVASASASFSS